MKLYNMDLSNFAAKCRLVIYEKEAPVEIVPIPGGDLKSAQYMKIYPLGKTPALDAGGRIIGESEVINEYLEDKFPVPPLLPKDAEGRAQARLLSRFHDLYLEPPLRALFPEITAARRNEELMAQKLGEVSARLDQLERMLASPYAAGAMFSLADCALVPTMFFATLMLPLLGDQPPTEARPRLDAWWAEVQKRPAVQRVIGEQQAALAKMQQS